MPRKKSADQARIEMKHFRRVNAPIIKDVYPSVESISISYTTSCGGAGGWDEEEEGTRTYNPNSQAWFTYDCKNINCKGTLELEDAVRETIFSGLTSKSDSYTCRMDVNRRGACLVRYRYTVSVSYRKAIAE